MHEPDPMDDLSLDDWGYGDIEEDLQDLSE